MQSTLAKAGKKQLGQILLKKGLLTEEQLDRAIEEQQSSRNKKLLGEVIIELGLAGEDQVVEALAEAYNVPYAKLTPRLVDPRVIDLIPREFLEKHGILPLFLVQGVLTVAMSEPANVFLLEEIGRITTHTVQVVAVSGADIQAILAQYVKSANVFVIDDIIEDVSADTFELIEAKSMISPASKAWRAIPRSSSW